MKKVLIVANIITQIVKFNIENIKILKDLGYEVHVACNLKDFVSCPESTTLNYIHFLHAQNIITHHVEFGRRIKGQVLFLKPYKQLSKIFEKHNFEFVHCHSMIGGLCGRLVCKKNKIPCLYTAHGFTFFKGSSIFNWLFAYPEDKILSKYTDCLITITKDDYSLACEKLNAKSTKYIHGIGVDVCKKINKIHCDELRTEFKTKDNFIVVSVGEINKNKNHLSVIKALNYLNIGSWKYIICGEGPEKKVIEKYITQHGLLNNVIFAGYREDVVEICSIANLFVHPSFREGLSVALMEAIASKVPVICSDIRGNYDLIRDSRRRFNPKKYKSIAKCIADAKNNYSSKEISDNFSHIKSFSIECVNDEMKKIYSEFINIIAHQLF